MKISTEIHSAEKLVGAEKAIELVAKAGFDPVYGARPLRRALQNKVEDKLSEEILEGKIKPDFRYICRVEDEDVIFTAKEKE